MLRSSRIPPLLSRITGDGIHTALLITSDGELLGSSSIPNSHPHHTHIHTPPHPTVKQPASASSSSTESTSSISSSPTSSSKFDHESMAALIAEVTSDYHRAGQELLLMNFHPPPSPHHGSSNVPPPPPFHARRPMRGGGGGGSGKSTTLTSGNGNGDSSNVGGSDNPSSSSSSTPSPRDHGSILSCLLLEMEMGLIGVASAGSDCLVIAIADQHNSSIKVEHGLMKARLTAVAGYIQDTFSQLNAAPL